MTKLSKDRIVELKHLVFINVSWYRDTDKFKKWFLELSESEKYIVLKCLKDFSEPANFEYSMKE